MIDRIKHNTRLICPKFKDEWTTASETDFWIDRKNVWHSECKVCGDGHYLSDFTLENLKPMGD